MRRSLCVAVVERRAQEVVQQQEAPPPHLRPLPSVLEPSVTEDRQAEEEEEERDTR